MILSYTLIITTWQLQSDRYFYADLS